MLDPTELIVATDKWRQEGQALREKLVAEQAELAKRMAEIHKRLAMIPAEKPGEGRTPFALAQMSEELDPNDGVSEITRKLLKAASKPMTAAELIDQIQVVRSDARRTTVHSILNQWKKKGLLQAQRRNGRLRFTWKDRT